MCSKVEYSVFIVNTERKQSMKDPKKYAQIIVTKEVHKKLKQYCATTERKLNDVACEVLLDFFREQPMFAGESLFSGNAEQIQSIKSKITSKGRGE